MKFRTRRGPEDAKREIQERDCSAFLSGGKCWVRVGQKCTQVFLDLSEARAILSRMGRQPAPLIWRALGVSS